MQQLILPQFLHTATPTLDNFIGHKNVEAVQAVKDILQPGRAIYLWGELGCGRSHLLQAASSNGGIYFNSENDQDKLLELSLADEIKHSIVAVDDVNLLTPQSQDALFSIYNRWREAATTKDGFAILVAGQSAPISMPVREDLRTRLGWDLTFKLHNLNDDERASAISNRANDLGLSLSPQISNWLLTHYSRNMMHLSLLVDALNEYTIQEHRAITIPLLKKFLQTFNPEQNTK